MNNCNRINLNLNYDENYLSLYSYSDTAGTWGSAYSVCLGRLIGDEGSVEVSLEDDEGDGGEELKTLGNFNLTGYQT